MSELICVLNGVRGRRINIYDRKCVIETDVTAGSILTGNATDGEKTIFYKDCTGVQYKESRLAIGYLQFETSSLQMNNAGSNFFSENTFTFEEGKCDVTNSLMREVYEYVLDRMEGYKYNDQSLLDQDLPPRLAALYGKRRPLTAQEKIQKANARAKTFEAIESKKQKYLEELKSESELIDTFIDQATRCSKFSEIMELMHEPVYANATFSVQIISSLSKQVALEKTFGSDQEKIKKYLKELKSKFVTD